MKVNLGNPAKNRPRYVVEIQPFDTWGLDRTLALIILPTLIQLKQTKHGIPNGFVQDSETYDRQLAFDFMLDDRDDVFQKACDAWDETLDKMIWSFQQIGLNEDYDGKYHHGVMDIGWEEVPSKSSSPSAPNFYRMVDKNPDDHWYDQEGHNLHNERIQEGLDLFAKYFRSLWD